MADDNLMSQEEIERLMSQSAGAAAASNASAPSSAASPSTPQSQSEIDALLAKKTAGGTAQSAISSQSPQTNPGDSNLSLAQDDIERLLDKGGRLAPSVAGKPAMESKPAASSVTLPGEGYLAQGDVEFLLSQAERALESINSEGTSPLPAQVGKFSLEEFAGAPPSTENATIDLIRDVELDLKIELGRTQMYLEDVLRLRKGSVVPLDKLAGDPVDIYVNGRLIARGEVLVLNDNFCVRVAELIAGAQALAR